MTKSSFEKQKQYFNWTMIFYIVLCFLLVTLLSISFVTRPKYPIFFYSVLGPSYDFSAIKYFLSATQITTLAYMCISLSHFEIIIFGFSHSIQNLLKFSRSDGNRMESFSKKAKLAFNMYETIFRTSTSLEFIELKSSSNTSQPAVDQTKPLGVHNLEVALGKHEQIKDLIDTFNELFSWFLVLYKALSLIQVCTLIFVALRRITQSPSASAVFQTTAVSYVVRICVLLPSMGSVYKESVKFKDSWSKILPELDPLNYTVKRRLKYCYPIGFRAGNFYHVTPTTVLTFFSITTTYLIVLLQL